MMELLDSSKKKDYGNPNSQKIFDQSLQSGKEDGNLLTNRNDEALYKTEEKYIIHNNEESNTR